MLTKENIVDKIEILEDGQMQIRTAKRIYDDGELISISFHRRVVKPGDDLEQEDVRIKEIAAIVHTPSVITAFRS